VSETLRDRIATAILNAVYDPLCNSASRSAADAVIAELGLHRQFLVDGIISDGEPRPWEMPCETRWTTEWSPYGG